MVFPRYATKQVLAALKWAPVVLVEGPRQAGKSVLVRELVGAERPASYLTFDDALTLASAREDAQGFILAAPDPVVIDEVQRAPEIFRPIKLSVDRDRRMGRFTLTGSANVLLLPQLSESLAGRMRIVTLWPLSQGEIEGLDPSFLNAAFADDTPPLMHGTESRVSIAERIVRGGFPEAVSLPSGEPRDGWMSAYTTTLLERDVRELSAVGERIALPRLLRILGTRSGTLLNVSDLGRATAIARATLDRYLALFTRVFAIQFVPAWSGDVARRLVKSPKILFGDSGLASYLAGLDAARLVADPDRLGSLLETFVGTELTKLIAASNERFELMHYRDAQGTEVDWIVENGRGELIGIEVKASTSPTERDFRGLRAFAKTVGKRFRRGILLHQGSVGAVMGEGMVALPVEALWRWRAE